MKNVFWVALTLTTLTLAGCVEEEAPPLTDDDCRALGMVLDPAVEQVDNETGETIVAPACVEDVPSVTVHMEGLPETGEAYFPIDLTWVMHTTLDKDHSHNNGIRVSTESDPSYVGKLDGYGDGILGGKEEHRDFVEGDSSTVTWVPEEPGTYYVRAYAVSAWGNYWAPEHEITITEVQPTGTNHDVAVSGGGLPGASSLDPADLEVALGDSVTWTSDEPVTWTIVRSNGPDAAERFSVGIDEPFVFIVPGGYEYDAIASDPATGQEIGRVSGSITVPNPE